MCGPTETRIEELHAGFTVSPEDVRTAALGQPESADAVWGRGHRLDALWVRRLRSARGFIRRAYLRFRASIASITITRGRRWRCMEESHLVRAAGGTGSRASFALAGVGRATLPPTLNAGPTESFPGLCEPVAAASWCLDHEHCDTIEDYLRRRTNIAQWIPRGGLGARSENLGTAAQARANLL